MAFGDAAARECAEREGTPDPDAPVVSFEGVTKRFGTSEVLKSVSLSIGRGEIRGLCGENGAGKSTLVKILAGIHPVDAGTVRVDGEPRDIRHPQEAQRLGIALVAQELSLAPGLSVLDNIWLGNREVPLFHRRKFLRDRAREALDKTGLRDVALEAPVARLSLGRRQLVEIARMLTRDARVLILDEPTAMLSDVEIEQIFATLRVLKAEGRSILYVTHRLGEVFEICDTVSVLRNGEFIGTRPTAEIDRHHLIEMILGRSMGQMYPRWQARHGEPMLVVRHLRVPNLVRDFHLVAGRGMVVCIAGQVGSGAIEVLRALAGLVAEATGEVAVMGRKLGLRSVPKAHASSVQFISEDRAGEGLFLRLSVQENLVATKLADHSRFGMLAHRRLQATALALARAVGVDTARLVSRADDLSGGNQQKVALGRSIGRGETAILLMNEPTRGVDVGARAEIYRLIRESCDRGHCIVMATSDIEEALGMADVLVTMYRGRQVGEYRRGDATLQRVLADITHPAATA